ncbi:MULTISPECIES: phage protein NinX family protein [unclassified Cupriavidus]|uniref:phage protein NinX family protein n=1 Tax=unclassified Cupriavidus TaxID=2640874 RepID=UPI00313BA42F
MKVSELEGALLDYWVAMADESWTWAHELFPTMTLDPKFKGVKLVLFADEEVERCLLVPRNAMRQELQHFAPSLSWEHGGPLIARHRIGVMPRGGQTWGAWLVDDMEPSGIAGSPLVAAMRALVASKFGELLEEVPNDR